MTRSDSSNAQRDARRDELESVARDTRGSFHTVEEITQNFLREAILRGLYRPGERLQQDAIAEMLGVSRMPVRSSLRQLEAEGLISIVPYKGAVVSALTTKEIAEIYDLRTIVETYLLERAMERMTPHRLAELEKLVEQADHVPDQVPDRRFERRQMFYERLYELSDAPWAFKLAQQLRTAVRRYLYVRSLDDEPTAHAALVKYLQAGDVGGARTWLAEHLAKVSARLQETVAAEEAVTGT